MPQFFIDRPVFAWVVSIFIMLFGALSATRLPVELYPEIAPPSVTVYATYPGATPKTMNDSVIEPLEREISGVENFLYMESSSDTSGRAQIAVTFAPGTDHQMAQVDVQNKVAAIEPRLPLPVRQLGLRIQSSSETNLMVVALTSESDAYDEEALGDYMARNVSEELKRIDGIGRVQEYFAPRALRIWVDPAKLTAYKISIEQIAAAVQEQNTQVSPGRLGAEPIVEGTKVSIPLIVQGELSSAEEFQNIILRSNPDGSSVLLSDVAEVSLGRENYGSSQSINGQPAVAAGIMLTPGANAVQTANRIYELMDTLEASFPEGVNFTYAYDSAPFVIISLIKVLQTFFIALALVFAIMFLFLQDWRATLIPAVVAPISLLGTFGVMYLTGFSVNVLTSFGMILAIGIIVDDAIVVTENVERIMAEEGLDAKAATRKGMREITGAVIGITLVLSAVFLPIAFATGAVGQIYRQFSLSLAVSILFSAFLALSLTPALCAAMLQTQTEDASEKSGFFGWFNRSMDKLTDRYTKSVGWIVHRSGRTMGVYLAITVATGWMFMSLPTGFLPVEDQGSWISNVQLDADASVERTNKVLKEYREYIAGSEDVKHVLQIQGFGFSGSGPNVGLMFTVMKDFEDREGSDVFQETAKANAHFAGLTDGDLINVVPPVVRSLGNSSGFAMRLMDRENQGQDALLASAGTALMHANQSEVLQYAYMEGLGESSMVEIHVDRQAARNLGVAFGSISSTISTALGSAYVNDFPNFGYQQQVIIQAQADARMNIDQVLALPVAAADGEMVPLSTVARAEVVQSPLQLIRYNGNPAIRLAGEPAVGYSSGQAMAEMERIVAEHLPSYTVEWTGLSYQERLSGNEAPALMLLSMLVVLLVLAALYESWSIPLSVLMVVPLGIFGALIAVSWRGLENDIFFKVGVVTLIGLTAKNAILIIEFAKQLEEDGLGRFEAAIEAARLRLRPILMTSLAFGLGVMPMVLERGASANSQNSIGTGVVGGMVTGTILAVFFVPAFYVFVRGIFTKKSDDDAPVTPETPNATAGGTV